MSDELEPEPPDVAARVAQLEDTLGRLQQGVSQQLECLRCFEESGKVQMPDIFEGRKRFESQESFTTGNFATQSWDANDQAYARLAFIFLVVHVAGGLVLTAFYYNFTAFEVYILALFWAMIVSIPLYQVKMTIMQLIFRRLLRETYEVLQVEEKHQKCKVQLRRLSRFRWFCVEDGGPENFEASVRRALVDPTAAKELRERLATSRFHATVAEAQRPWIEEYWEQQHWLGPLRPYESFMDVFRDVWTLAGGAIAFLHFLWKPFDQFRNQADSAPYFGLLLRLCALQLVYKLWSREFGSQLGALVLVIYLALVCLRLAAWTVGAVAPMLWLRMPRRLRQELQRIQLLARRMIGGSVSHWLQARWDKAVEGFQQNCHFLLSMLIIVAAMLLALNFVSFLVVSLHHEVQVIRSTCYDFLQKQQAYQSFMEQLSQAGAMDGGLVGSLTAQLEEKLPEYEKMLARHIPDFHILKYILYDIWNDPAHAGDLAFRHEVVGVCDDAAALGAECNAEQHIVMKHALRNTTSLLRGLVAGNLTDISSLLTGAYGEVSAISSLFNADASQSSSAAEALKDGAAYGGTLIAKLTYLLPSVVLDLLVSASSLLGQFVVFMTALFYLLSAEESCMAVVGEFLRVVDHKQVIFKITERVMRAVLVSAMKMSAFHALFTWLLYSFGQMPIVVVPTVLSAILALVPKVSPVWSVSFWATVYLWVHQQKAWAALYFLLNLGVWWQVPTVIYAEIPEANAWLTGLGVVLGMNQFGFCGVVLGPLLASVPLICYNLVKLFNTPKQQAGEEARPAQRRSLWNLHEDFAHNLPSPSHASHPSSGSETEELRSRASPEKPEEAPEARSQSRRLAFDD